MRCLCIGICQIIAVSTILKNNPLFTSIYDDIQSYTIFTISESEMNNILENIVPTCDLILSQPVSNTYKNTHIYSTETLRSKIKPGCIHLVIANCYFTGYDPNPFQTTDQNGSIIHYQNISYFPSLCIESLIKGDSHQSCIDWCNLSAYSIHEINRNYTQTMTELKNRENKIFDNPYGVDITISDFIENQYKSQFLFHTYNHPTNILLFELVRRIFARLCLPLVSIGDNINTELLGDVTIPPPPSVYIQSNMTFPYPKFKIYGQYMTTKETMSKFCAAIANSDPILHNRWLSSVKYGRSKINPI